MNILIAYYTKTGTTARCAAMLRERFYHHEMTVADLAQEHVDPTPYDVVVLGAPIRMGHIDKRMLAFVKTNEAQLLSRELAFFVCCGLPQEAQPTLERDIPAPLLAHALAAVAVGGELRVEAQHGFAARMLVRLMRRSIKNKQLDDDIDEEDKPRFPEIMPDQINRLADAIKAARTK